MRQALGVKLNEQANASGGPQISAPDCRVSVWVIPTNEELMIAQHTLALISAKGMPKRRRWLHASGLYGMGSNLTGTGMAAKMYYSGIGARHSAGKRTSRSTAIMNVLFYMC